MSSISARSKPGRGRRTTLPGLLSAAGALACAGTLLGFLGAFSWIADLFVHFRIQYLLGLSLLGAVLLLCRKYRTAAVFFAFAVLNASVVVPLYVGRQAAPPQDTPTLRVMLINVNTQRGDPLRVEQAVREADPDVLVLQEVSVRWMNKLAGLRVLYPHVCAEPQEDNFGIALFSKRPLEKAAVAWIGAAGVPSITARLETAGGPLAILATHPLPPIGADYWRLRNEQLDRLPEHLDPSVPTLLLGDLNTTPWSPALRRLLRRSGLRDSARGFGVQPSWPADMRLLRIPLDHALHSPGIIVLRRSIGPDVGSDHFPLCLDLCM